MRISDWSSDLCSSDLEDQPPPAGGILLPANAGEPFTLALRLVRQAYESYRALMVLGPQTNFYYAPPPDSWQTLASAERQERVVGGIRAFMQSEGLYPDDVELLRLERNKYSYELRVVVGVSERIKAGEQTSLIGRLDGHLGSGLGGGEPGERRVRRGWVRR